MATANLLPDSTVSNDWTVSSGTAHAVLADTTESTNIQTNAQNKVCIVGLSNFTESFGSIDTIRYYVSAVMYRSRADDSDLQIKIENAAGAALTTETENIVVNGGAYADYYGPFIAGVGAAAWKADDSGDSNDLNGLRLQLNTNLEDPPNISFVRITRAYIEVTYTPAADNATFFGANF